jgi:hypothetical protein
MNDIKWSKTEKEIARKAFEKAYERECADLVNKVRTKAGNITKPGDIWRLHDFLTRKRKEIEKKYDYRYSVLFLVFAQLIKDGWLDFKDLEGLAEEKIGRIAALVDVNEAFGKRD